MCRSAYCLSLFASGALLLLTAREADAEEPVTWKLPPPQAAAPDDLSGHILIAPRVSWLVPLGAADSVTNQNSITGTGVAFGLDLGVGISRYVDVHGRFDYGLLGRGDTCPSPVDCSGRSTAFGLGLTYHLVNGAAFDPWLQVGVGYRMTTFEQTGTAAYKHNYRGFEYLHLAVGGEWYASQRFGVGPYFALDAGWYSTRPSIAEAESAHHTFLSLGLRGVFDWAR